MRVCPAIVAVPVRVVPVPFALTAIVTDPFPVPDAPPVTNIHSTFELAVHVQVDPVVTLKGPLPPLAETDALVGEMA